ncbi:hypothetical protein [Streptomyces sp. NPDC002088]|uniref:hypothetical protein n=1 Tax=Streptomyces sp. NPDC002088 TaxID=3154665 RepID=UPI003324A644
MTGAGGRRRRLRRRVVVTWAVAVAVGGGVTLWLQDSAEPQGPYGRQEQDPSQSPAPLLWLDESR